MGCASSTIAPSPDSGSGPPHGGNVGGAAASPTAGGAKEAVREVSYSSDEGPLADCRAMILSMTSMVLCVSNKMEALFVNHISL